MCETGGSHPPLTPCWPGGEHPDPQPNPFPKLLFGSAGHPAPKQLRVLFGAPRAPKPPQGLLTHGDLVARMQPCSSKCSPGCRKPSRAEQSRAEPSTFASLRTPSQKPQTAAKPGNGSRQRSPKQGILAQRGGGGSAKSLPQSRFRTPPARDASCKAGRELLAARAARLAALRKEAGGASCCRCGAASGRRVPAAPRVPHPRQLAADLGGCCCLQRHRAAARRASRAVCRERASAEPAAPSCAVKLAPNAMLWIPPSLPATIACCQPTSR